MEKVKIYFHVKGRTSYVEFEKYLPLTWAGKRLLPVKVAKEIEAVTGFRTNSVFCKLEALGFKKDVFFSAIIEVPTNWLRRPRSGFRLADTANVTA